MIKAQILVVEDQAPTADLILEVLRAEGYDVQTVDTLAKRGSRLLGFGSHVMSSSLSTSPTLSISNP